jgi:hypothetical protein
MPMMATCEVPQAIDNADDLRCKGVAPMPPSRVEPDQRRALDRPRSVGVITGTVWRSRGSCGLRICAFPSPIHWSCVVADRGFAFATGSLPRDLSLLGRQGPAHQGHLVARQRRLSFLRYPGRARAPALARKATPVWSGLAWHSRKNQPQVSPIDCRDARSTARSNFLGVGAATVPIRMYPVALVIVTAVYPKEQHKRMKGSSSRLRFETATDPEASRQ